MSTCPKAPSLLPPPSPVAMKSVRKGFTTGTGLNFARSCSTVSSTYLTLHVSNTKAILKWSARTVSIQAFSMRSQVGPAACEQWTTGQPSTKSRSPLIGEQWYVQGGACVSCHVWTEHYTIVHYLRFLLEILVGCLDSGSHFQVVRRRRHLLLQPFGPRLVDAPRQSGAM